MNVCMGSYVTITNMPCEIIEALFHDRSMHEL